MFCCPRLVAFLRAFVLAEMQTTRILTLFFPKFERAGSRAARLLGQVAPGGHLPGDQEGAEATQNPNPHDPAATKM
jgi:hypothetical protein